MVRRFYQVRAVCEMNKNPERDKQIPDFRSLMESTWIKQRRIFDRRRNGLFKKAFEIQRRCQAKVYIVMEYEGSYYVYRNSRKTNWPPPPGAPV